MNLLIGEFLVSLVLLTIRPYSVYGTTCTDAYACEGDTITDTAYCYGYYACRDATIDGTSAYCNGFGACYSAEEITTTGILVCNGYYGCWSAASFTAGAAASCNGYGGCYGIQSTLSVASSIFCNGDYSCAFNDNGNGIVTNSGSIHCSGNYACTYAILDSGDDIYCDGDFGCRSAEMDSDDNIYCYGNFGCWYSTMEAADYIYAYSRYSARSSTITNTERILSYGFYSTSYADISSSGVDTLRVYLYGFYSGFSLDITCESGSDCYIYCDGNGCYNTDITCNGDCTISCDDNCDSCPTESTSYYEIWDDYQKEKKLLKENMKNKLLQLENEYVGSNDFETRLRIQDMIEENRKNKDNKDDALLLKQIEEINGAYDEQRNKFYDLNNNNGISKYIKEFDDEFIKLRRKYGLYSKNKKQNSNKSEKQELIVNSVNHNSSLKNNSSSLYCNIAIGMTCLAFVSIVMNLYQCYINHKNTKDSKYIEIVSI